LDWCGDETSNCYACFEGATVDRGENSVYRQAVETTHKVSAQLRAAEDQIRELEEKARYQENRADRAEKWLYQISVEIEQKFFGRVDERPSPAPQSVSRNQQR
jgi:hypothetical protein